MKTTNLFTLGLLGLTLVALPAPAAAADGKTIFTEYKCNQCHTIDAAGVAKVEGEEEEEEEAPDLSKAGKEHDKVFIAKYLMKRVEIDGKKHKKRFTGSNQELVTLATWLAGLK